MKLQIAIDGKSYEVEVELLEDDSAPRMPNYGPYPIVPATVQSPQAQGARSEAPSVEENANVNEEKVCRSPVAGVVIKVNVEPGQAIQANDLMMVLEAMKMETNVTAPVAGKVKSVKVAQGDAVKVNQVVVEFE
ncbi:MAG: biotin/lipoyl-containing protein [Terriglobales bacterium]